MIYELPTNKPRHKTKVRNESHFLLLSNLMGKESKRDMQRHQFVGSQNRNGVHLNKRSLLNPADMYRPSIDILFKLCKFYYSMRSLFSLNDMSTKC